MKAIYLILGFISLFLGIIGIILPVLPTTPFLLLTLFLFSRASDKFYNWFISTKIYKEHLDEFAKTRTMSLKKKITLLAFASTILIASFMIIDFWHARLVIILVIIFKYYYFIFRIKTK